MGQVVEIARRRKRARSNEKRNVPPGRGKNADLREREYLTPDEAAAMVMQAGKVGRHPVRDRAIILALYRHGLRVSELISLRWSQVDFKRAEMHVRRKKSGTPSVQPIVGDELRLLRKVKREYGDGKRERARSAAVPIFRRQNRRASRRGCGTGRSQSPSAHVATRYRILSCESGYRHANNTSLSRTPLDPAHRTLYGISAGTFQRFVGLNDASSDSSRAELGLSQLLSLVETSSNLSSVSGLNDQVSTLLFAAAPA